MNNNTKAKLIRLRRADRRHIMEGEPELCYFRFRVRQRPGHKGKVACLTYGKRFEWTDGLGKDRVGTTI